MSGMRQTLKDQIMTALATLTTANGYSQNYGTPSDHFRDQASIEESECPVVCLAAMITNHEENTNARTGYSARVILRVVEKHQDAGDRIYDEQQDVEKLVKANRHWGQDDLINTELVTTSTYSYGDEAWADVEFEVFWTEVNP